MQTNSPAVPSRSRWPLFTWTLSLFTWKNLRRASITLAILGTLLAIVYAIENWRGRRAWEACRQELEAKGERLDWSAFVPSPIPDDENVIKAPKMAEWFIKAGPVGPGRLQATNGLNLFPPNLYQVAQTNAKTPVVLAQIAITQSTPPANATTTAIQFADPQSRERLTSMVRDLVGPSIESPQLLTLVQQPLDRSKPIHFALQSDQPLSVADLSPVFPPGLVSSNVGHLQIEGTASNSFQVVLARRPTVSAGEFLAASDSVEPEINLIREALKRPKIQLQAGLDRPFDLQIVNFITIRSLAQRAAARAQSYLLLGKSEQAFQELSLIFESRKFLASRPITLVAAMIDVAVCGLYAETIAEGFRLDAWREPELVALQKQLQQIHLAPAVIEAFRTERAATRQTFEAVSASEIAGMFTSSENKSSLSKYVHPVYLLLKFAPRGWLYQNFSRFSRLEQITIESYDPANESLDPGKVESVHQNFMALSQRSSPYTLLGRFAVPNITKASQTLARNQTRVNQALIVCGLERYRLAHGTYPESLDALAPKFLEKLPSDFVGGKPLQYSRVANGTFLLYSIGWNGRDDGGQSSWTKGPSPDFSKGDWVWEAPLKWFPIAK